MAYGIVVFDEVLTKKFIERILKRNFSRKIFAAFVFNERKHFLFFNSKEMCVWSIGLVEAMSKIQSQSKAVLLVMSEKKLLS